MRRIRIYTEQALETERTVELEPGPSRHLVRVLRQRKGYPLVLFNGDGHEYFGTITATGPGDHCSVAIERRIEVDVESPLSIDLVQAVARGDRMDWCIRKACELGVTGIRPVYTERTEVRLEGKRADKRQRHWQQVAVAACEQSGRVRVPPIEAPVKLTELNWPPGRRLHLDPLAETALSRIEPPDQDGFILVIGPEGGLTEQEMSWLERQGSTGTRLGPRVLRTETAGPAAIAALQTVLGDWR
ncbi:MULTISPECIES: 16S rRNA (uracil(1498)-N(3))-methyltransferase [unclassified Wenzhouxiangella]|uniref:16S rRNA (uracil(1498)-N(3))-methyltransferase n=1 Tax=unclassified Wenzhouxiangella TaxID=2613841 RepID=UPI000E3291D8|nr:MULTISPECIES: 16S rRNA (uracil(1498)-N(3))-methyltransferase [unclassified Wenzhouxiangella]RFF28498.1 16S rRNA (uracil(1498)-N(3))-methyltransferase [Wenzhouxiangella sp. 15181]RFP70016.1 16S rRNA (uracil(1498)-N(3))-methyltransferase [Wenzhouxiangella sp. 15190]